MSDYVSPEASANVRKHRRNAILVVVSASAVIAGAWAGVAYGRDSAASPESPAGEAEECVPMVLNAPPMVKGCVATDDDDETGRGHTPGPSFPGATVKR